MLLIVGLLCLPAAPSADTAQYFYDELGRLAGVVDGSGNAAVYVYDEVGNLLRIDRFTAGAAGLDLFFVAPGAARAGTSVTIQGFGFSATPSANQVTFGSTTATVVSATTSSLVARVPNLATSGPVSVRVTNANGTVTKPNFFTVLVPPVITGVDPGSVAQGVTSRLIIEGLNLATAHAVTFTQSGITAAILSGGTTTNLPINLTVGAAVPLGSYGFSVTTPVGTTQSGTVTVKVVTAVPTAGIANSVSVVRPLPAQVPPTGPGTTVAPSVSVQILP